MSPSTVLSEQGAPTPVAWTRLRPPRSLAPAARRKEADDPGLIGQVLGSPAVKSFLRSAGSALEREITRGIFGAGRRR